MVPVIVVNSNFSFPSSTDVIDVMKWMHTIIILWSCYLKRLIVNCSFLNLFINLNPKNLRGRYMSTVTLPQAWSSLSGNLIIMSGSNVFISFDISVSLRRGSLVIYSFTSFEFSEVGSSQISMSSHSDSGQLPLLHFSFHVPSSRRYWIS